MMTNLSSWRKPAGIPLLLLLLFSLSACRTLKLDPSKKSVVVVRESHANSLLDQVALQLVGPWGSAPIPLDTTDELGYAELDWKDLARRLPPGYDRNDYYLHYERSFTDAQGDYTCRDSIRLNLYLGFIDLYIDSSRNGSPAHTFEQMKPVADMHYHISMRTHNRFGDQLYFNGDPNHQIPDNINLFKTHPHLRVLYEGKWKRPYLGKIKFDRAENGGLWTKRRDKMKTLLHTQWVRPKSKFAVNHLKQYTQATHPHLVEGGVYLAYNAISPFEHNVSNTSKKRFANTTFVTKANKRWLRRIGWKDDTLTHWQNFNHEYAMITSQQGFYDHAGWRFFSDTVDLYEDKPTIINVLEGSHVFQDQVFPHVVNYNLANRSSSENRGLFNELLTKRTFAAGRPLRTAYEQLLRSIRDNVPITHTDTLKVLAELLLPIPPRINKSHWKTLGPGIQNQINDFIDQQMLDELTHNINALKQLPGPPVAMVTIAHLTYNGMFGHAPGLNGGGFFTKIFAQKNYSIRVSDDPTYKKQWASAFFTIPGVNKFGEAVIDGLISTDNGPRIMIDLKHSDFFTRRYFFDKVMLDPATGDTIPPICSHCGVTGLPNPYYSPLTDEFSLLQSPSTTTFYPFGINIYDEEITTICQYGGIIGIPLFQQVLGGNIKTRRPREYRIKRDGRKIEGKFSRPGRHKEIRRIFTHLAAAGDPAVMRALQYTHDDMGVNTKSRITFKRAVEDYISAEPFIQNLFYILDHSGYLLPTGLDPIAWQRVCIGSDLDGLIDPIDICPTASLYPNFRERLLQFIPIFLKIRQMNDPKGMVAGYDAYFPAGFPIDRALDYLFYESLRDFSARHLLQGPTSTPTVKTR